MYQLLPPPKDDIGVSDKKIMDHDGVTNSCIGNKNFQALVCKSQHEYMVAAKLDKTSIVMGVVKEVVFSGSYFLNKNGGCWVEVTPEMTQEKTSQAFWENDPELSIIFDTNDSIVATNKETNAVKNRKWWTEKNSINSFVLLKQCHIIQWEEQNTN